MAREGRIVTHEELVQRGVRWLRGSKKCGTVAAEIHTAACCIPDVIGWHRRFSHLIECKTSRSDFHADHKKHAHRVGRLPGMHRWYFTPPGLVTPEEVPEGWGLLELRRTRVYTIVKAPRRTLTSNENDEEKLILLSIVRRQREGRILDPGTGRFSPRRR